MVVVTFNLHHRQWSNIEETMSYICKVLMYGTCTSLLSNVQIIPPFEKYISNIYINYS